MTIKSMTAFAGGEERQEKLTVSIEVRAYNSRYLDVNMKIPSTYSGLEERVRTTVGRYLSRGRVEVRVQVKDESEDAGGFEVDTARAAAYHRTLNDLQKLLDIQTPLCIKDVTAAGGIIKPAETVIDLEMHWTVIETCLNRVLADFNTMRENEGANLAVDFNARLQDIETAVGVIEKESDGLIDIYRKRLEERLRVLTNGVAELDSTRIVQEAAMLADRSDISEEIVRARSHVKQFREIMDGPEPAGRKLNFLLQEMNREFNTMGSKTGNADISHVIVNMKSELEKLREQVQNVE